MPTHDDGTVHTTRKVSAVAKKAAAARRKSRHRAAHKMLTEMIGVRMVKHHQTTPAQAYALVHHLLPKRRKRLPAIVRPVVRAVSPDHAIRELHAYLKHGGGSAIALDQAARRRAAARRAARTRALGGMSGGMGGYMRPRYFPKGKRHGDVFEHEVSKYLKSSPRMSKLRKQIAKEQRAWARARMA